MATDTCGRICYGVDFGESFSWDTDEADKLLEDSGVVQFEDGTARILALEDTDVLAFDHCSVELDLEDLQKKAKENAGKLLVALQKLGYTKDVEPKWILSSDFC